MKTLKEIFDACEGITITEDVCVKLSESRKSLYVVGDKVYTYLLMNRISDSGGVEAELKMTSSTTMESDLAGMEFLYYSVKTPIFRLKEIVVP